MYIDVSKRALMRVQIHMSLLSTYVHYMYVVIMSATRRIILPTDLLSELETLVFDLKLYEKSTSESVRIAIRERVDKLRTVKITQHNKEKERVSIE